MRQSRTAQDFTSLLRRVCSLKPMNYLFPEFSVYHFQTTIDRRLIEQSEVADGGGGVHRACISLPRHSSPHATPPRLPVPTPETHSASEASPLVSASVWATHWAPGCGLGLCRLVPDSSAAATAGSSRRAAHRAWYLGEQDRQAPACSLPLHLPSPSATPHTPTRGRSLGHLPQRTTGPGRWEVG